MHEIESNIKEDQSMKSLISSNDSIKEKIFVIRGVQVMLDSDLSEMYEVPVKVLNQAVKRNMKRFPQSFIFKLSIIEKDELVTNCDRFQNLKHSSQNPYAFTEQGVAMLSGVLKSDTAIRISIQIIEAFISMRKFIASNAKIFYRLDSLEQKQIESDKKFDQIFDAIESKDIKPEKGIFFDGQIFDSYKFISDLIRSATKSIVLIDNFVDDSVLTLFSKRKEDVSVVIYTKNISKELKLDVEKYNSQYPHVSLKKFDYSHDRFMVIDDNLVYHIGASLKDLGKKWFAFSKLDKEGLKIIERL